MRLITLFVILVLTSCSSKYDLIIKNANIIDINTGVFTTGDVLIKDSLIVQITKSNSASD